MLGNEVRVRSFETDVMRDRCAPMGVVVRCVSTADSSLSLSLSLCSQFLSAENGAPTGFLAGLRRVFGRGFCRSVLVCRLGNAGPAPSRLRDSVSFSIGVGRGSFPRVYRSKGNLRILRRFERRCYCPSPVVAFEEAPLRFPTRAGAGSAERRGLAPMGPRRSPFFGVSSRNRGAFVPSVCQEEMFS